MRTPTPEDLTLAAVRLGKALGDDPDPANPGADLRAWCENAWQIIAAYLGEESVPEGVMKQAVHTVALEIQRREKAPGGVLAAFGGDGGPIRLARDPLTPAIPILRPFISAGIG